MIENDKLAEWIDRYNRNELHGKELQEFEELLRKDPELRKEVRVDQYLNELLKNREEIDLRRKLSRYRIPNRQKGINFPLILMAASILIVITLTIFFYFMIRIDEVPVTREMEYTYYPADTSIFRGSGSIRAFSETIDGHRALSEVDPFLAESRRLDAFDPYPQFESLVSEILRSPGFQLITPKSPAWFNIGDIIDFTWKPSARPVTLVFLTNKGKELCRYEQLITGKLSFKTTSMSPGLYYIKFIGNEEILFFSKFTLN